MNFLNTIVNQKRQRVSAAKVAFPPDLVQTGARKARETGIPHALLAALTDQRKPNIIAEFKRRSPSKGEIRRGADPQIITAAYEAGGAAAISVLTEEDHFDGSLDDLRRVRQTIALPILRKDFIFEDYQVYESAAAGADALLLIVAALDDETLNRLRGITEDELGMDALIEVHTSAEMQRAVNLGARLIGINNRNLSTFEVSLETSSQLLPMSTEHAVLVSESGIESVSDIRRLHDLGYSGFLIGESLMRAVDPEAALRELTQKRIQPKEESVGQ